MEEDGRTAETDDVKPPRTSGAPESVTLYRRLLLPALVLAFTIAACSGRGSYIDDGPTSAPLGIDNLPTDDAPPPEEIAENPQPEAKPLPVKVTKRTKSVDPNDTASVSIKTTKGAKCSINVEYKSGSATAKGLGKKKADSKGAITWKWKVGGRTTAGEWPIDIWCEKGDRSGDVSTSFTVR